MNTFKREIASPVSKFITPDVSRRMALTDSTPNPTVDRYVQRHFRLRNPGYTKGISYVPLKTETEGYRTFYISRSGERFGQEQIADMTKEQFKANFAPTFGERARFVAQPAVKAASAAKSAAIASKGVAKKTAKVIVYAAVITAIAIGAKYLNDLSKPFQSPAAREKAASEEYDKEHPIPVSEKYREFHYYLAYERAMGHYLVEKNTDLKAARRDSIYMATHPAGRYVQISEAEFESNNSSP